jgi:hypothetical protein
VLLRDVAFDPFGTPVLKHRSLKESVSACLCSAQLPLFGSPSQVQLPTPQKRRPHPSRHASRTHGGRSFRSSVRSVRPCVRRCTPRGMSPPVARPSVRSFGRSSYLPRSSGTLSTEPNSSDQPIRTSRLCSTLLLFRCV